MATHSRIPAWEIPWAEEAGSPWGHKDSDTVLGVTKIQIQSLGSQIQTQLSTQHMSVLLMLFQ